MSDQPKDNAILAYEIAKKVKREFSVLREADVPLLDLTRTITETLDASMGSRSVSPSTKTE